VGYFSRAFNKEVSEDIKVLKSKFHKPYESGTKVQNQPSPISGSLSAKISQERKMILRNP